MKEDLVKKIGLKAYSLKLLKEEGLFEGNLYISRTLPEKVQFFNELKEVGFSDGEEYSARTSHPSQSVKLPRKICTSFQEIYDFYKENLGSDKTIVIHNLIHAKYGGIISLIEGELVLELSEGDWNIDYVRNKDTAIFGDTESTWYLYKDKRSVQYVDVDEVKTKTIEPLDDASVKKIFDGLKPKLAGLRSLLSDEYNSLELFVDRELKIKPLQLSNVETGFSGLRTNNSSEELFEVKTPHDLKNWDKKTKLLLSIPASVDKADALMSVISEVKKYTNIVYISYGVLSHPAILLREAGIVVERRISNFRVVKFTY